MRTLHVTIQCDNAAFGETPSCEAHEIATLLDELSNRFWLSADHADALPFIIRDSNGNRVGKAEFITEPD